MFTDVRTYSYSSPHCYSFQVFSIILAVFYIEVNFELNFYGSCFTWLLTVYVFGYRISPPFGIGFRMSAILSVSFALNKRFLVWSFLWRCVWLKCNVLKTLLGVYGAMVI